jgi:ABC-type nitrate/sulfonate/bicarbonate transport system substrate-binding protein
MKALFPHDGERRKFLSAVGASTAWAAISSLIPFGALEAMAQEKGSAGKEGPQGRLHPITCASPLIMADPLGFYKKEGLNVSMVKTAGWALIRDKVLNKEYDASHMLAPMPIAISMGIGSNPSPTNVMTIQNINGQAIVLAQQAQDNRDPKNWKGFKFAIPFEFSIHNLLLRYYLAEHGINPDTDVQLRVVPPPEMVANLRAGNIDGFLGPDPVNQRAVYDELGFIHILSREIWDGHPCCSFAVADRLHQAEPQQLRRAVPRHPQGRQDGARPEEPADHGRGAGAGQLPQPAEGGAGTGADRQVRRRPGQREERARARGLRPLPLVFDGLLDPDADEALGLRQGRRQVQGHRREGVPADRCEEVHGRSRHDAAQGDHEEVQGHGQGVRPAKADAYVNSFAIRKA